MKEHTQPIATVDAVILTLKENKLHILLTKREKEPFEGMLSLPGGWIFTDEDLNLDEAISRVLMQKTGVNTPYFEQVETRGSATRDPRHWSISTSYISLMPWDTVKNAQAGRNVSDVQWTAVDELKNIELAFDHFEIVQTALKRLRNKVNYSNLPVYLLPEKFTKTQLQNVYESVLCAPLDKSAFRKKLNEFDFLEETGEMQTGSHRPAMLYRIKPDSFICFNRNLKK